MGYFMAHAARQALLRKSEVIMPVSSIPARAGTTLIAFGALD